MGTLDLWYPIWIRHGTMFFPLNPVYYITSDPKVYPISDDKEDQALNQLNIPILKKIQTSGFFKPEPPLPEDPRESGVPFGGRRLTRRDTR